MLRRENPDPETGLFGRSSGLCAMDRSSLRRQIARYCFDQSIVGIKAVKQSHPEMILQLSGHHTGNYHDAD
jgi:hypothetical protein